MFQGFFVVISRKVPQCFKFQVKLMSVLKEIFGCFKGGFFVVISRKVPQCFKFQVKLMSVSKEISRQCQGYLKEVQEVSGVFRECFKKVQRIFKVFQQRKFTGWRKVD